MAHLCYAEHVRVVRACWMTSIVKHDEGKAVKRNVLALVLGLLCCGAVQAAAVDLDNNHAVQARVSDLSTVMRNEVALPSSMSELPEPEVFAMMVVGVILIGFKVSRDSSDKFK